MSPYQSLSVEILEPEDSAGGGQNNYQYYSNDQCICAL